MRRALNAHTRQSADRFETKCQALEIDGVRFMYEIS